MMLLEKIIKESRFTNVILTISIFLTIATFFWLAIQENHVVKEINHMVSADFNELQRDTIRKNDLRLESEVRSHLKQSIQDSHLIFFVISAGILFLSTIWFLTFLYFRRLRKIKIDEKLLDELLYYHQLTDTPVNSAVRSIQLNRDQFAIELEKGLIENQFVLHYQPIIDIHRNQIISVEALIRWQHPTYGLLTPDLFLPLCENNGFIIPLGKWIFQTACVQIKKWHESGFDNLYMSINLSPRQLNDENLLPFVTEILRKEEGIAQYLVLEITENVLMRNAEMSMVTLNSLKSLGLQLSLDDFGTGYSSLKNVKQLPVNQLKIDKLFIRDLISNTTSLGIVKSVIALSKSLGFSTTAEGVENQEQLDLLKALECDRVQGYLYSKPIASEKLTTFLSQFQRVAGETR